MAWTLTNVTRLATSAQPGARDLLIVELDGVRWRYTTAKQASALRRVGMTLTWGAGSQSSGYMRELRRPTT